MRVHTTALILSFLLLQGCNSGNSGGHYSESYTSDNSDNDDETSDEVTGSNSEEVAEESTNDGGGGNVHYYNPNTGTNSDYTLDVEHDGNGDVERINFDHGGYIDDSHITNQEHNGDGTITVTTDRGVDYTVEESPEESNEEDN